MLIKQAVSHLNSVAKIIEQLRCEMNQVASQLPEYKVVLEMTGVGVSLGPQLIAEIGDVRRFSNRGALTALQDLIPVLTNLEHMSRKVLEPLKEDPHNFEKRCS